MWPWRIDCDKKKRVDNGKINRRLIERCQGWTKIENDKSKYWLSSIELVKQENERNHQKIARIIDKTRTRQREERIKNRKLAIEDIKIRKTHTKLTAKNWCITRIYAKIFIGQINIFEREWDSCQYRRSAENVLIKQWEEAERAERMSGINWWLG